jgi:hypothetical protein
VFSVWVELLSFLSFIFRALGFVVVFILFVGGFFPSISIRRFFSLSLRDFVFVVIRHRYSNFPLRMIHTHFPLLPFHEELVPFICLYPLAQYPALCLIHTYIHSLTHTLVYHHICRFLFSIFSFLRLLLLSPLFLEFFLQF